jgi:hypothetical protein
MKAGIALIWKEWREVRWSFFALVMIFIGFPLFFVLSFYIKPTGEFYYSPFGAETISGLATICAIFTASWLTCSDIRVKRLDFLLSKPIHINKWVTIKYFVGLAVIIFVYLSAIIIEYCASRPHAVSDAASRPERPTYFGYEILYSFMNTYTFTIVLIYGVSFFIGCVVRRTVYSAIFSVVVALLVYFLPLLFSPLGGFSVFNIMNEEPVRIIRFSLLGHGGPGYSEKLHILRLSSDLGIRYNIEWFRYILICVGSVVLSIIFSVLAIRKGWRLKVGQKLVFWFLGIVGLLILLTFAFQVGSNLKCIEQISLKPILKEKQVLTRILPSGSQGLLMFADSRERFGHGAGGVSISRYDFSGGNRKIGPTIALGSNAGEHIPNWPIEFRSVLWSVKHPDLVYYITGQAEPESDKRRLYFCTALLNEKTGEASIVHKLDIGLSPSISKNFTGNRDYGMAAKNDKAYIWLFSKLTIIDLAAPDKPSLGRTVDTGLGFGGESGGFDRKSGYCKQSLFLNMIPMDNLSIEERLEITIALTSRPDYSCPYHMSVSGRRVAAAGETIRVYEFADDMGQRQSNRAVLDMTAWQLQTPLERYRRQLPRCIFIDGDFVCAFFERGGGCVTVFDVSKAATAKRTHHYTSTATVKRAGHYASAATHNGIRMIAPLPGEGILVGMEDKLQIVALPN